VLIDLITFATLAVLYIAHDLRVNGKHFLGIAHGPRTLLRAGVPAPVTKGRQLHLVRRDMEDRWIS
jgi:hypothetical protein